MRALFVLVVLANVALFAIGRGWMGIPPAEQGRDPVQLQRQMNAEAVKVLPLARP